METFGERLRMERQKKRLSQQKLADSVGTTKQTISNYEASEVARLDSDKLDKLARILDTTVEYLKTGKGEPGTPGMNGDNFLTNKTPITMDREKLITWCDRLLGMMEADRIDRHTLIENNHILIKKLEPLRIILPEDFQRGGEYIERSMKIFPNLNLHICKIISIKSQKYKSRLL